MTSEERYILKMIEFADLEADLNYESYILSSAWQRKADRARERANHTCTLCGSEENLEIHHLSYRRMGWEFPADLQCLCRECHRKVHSK